MWSWLGVVLFIILIVWIAGRVGTMAHTLIAVFDERKAIEAELENIGRILACKTREELDAVKEDLGL